MDSASASATARLDAWGSPSVRRALVAAVLVVLVLAMLSSSLLGGNVFGSDNIIFTLWPFGAHRPPGFVRPSNSIMYDIPFYYHPIQLQIRADLHKGILPLWDPYEGGGLPLLGYPQSAALFPITWLSFLLPFWSSLGWLAAARLLLASGGMYLFCRDLRLRRGSSLLGAIAFAFGLGYVVWLEHIDVADVWMMMPWMLLAARWVCTRGSLLAGALLGGVCGLSWLGGHTESEVLLLIATAAFAAWELVAEATRGPNPATLGRPWGGPAWTKTMRWRILLLAIPLGLGVGVSAMVNLPFLQFLHLSPPTQRGAPGVPFPLGWSFVFPELWGNPAKAFYSPTYGIGPYNYVARAAYFGALPLLLGVASLGRRRPREQWFFAALALVCLATIFNTPIWANAVRSLPGGDVVNFYRLLIVVGFAGAVLAAYGLERWLTGSSLDRRRMLWIMGIVAVLPVVVWLPRHLALLSSLPSALGQLPAVHSAVTSARTVALGSVWRWVVFCGVGIAGLAAARRLRSPTLAIALVIMLTGVDLVTLGRGFHGSVPQAQADPPAPATVRYLQEHEGDARVTASGPVLWGKLPQLYGLNDPRVGDEPIRPTRYWELWSSLGGTGTDDEMFEPQQARAHRLADVFATRYVLLAPGEPAPSWLKPVFTAPDGTVGLNGTALPRAWVAYNWRQASSQSRALTATLKSTTSQLLNEPIIEGAAPPPAGRTPSAVRAQVTAQGPNSITLQATARQPGYLILDDSAYPGWQASRDGHPVSWKPANENFRAVPIPVGKHAIRFTYRPASVLIGAIISALCVLALIALGVVGWIWRSHARDRAADEPSTESREDARPESQPVQPAA